MLADAAIIAFALILMLLSAAAFLLSLRCRRCLVAALPRLIRFQADAASATPRRHDASAMPMLFAAFAAEALVTLCPPLCHERH